MKKALTGLCVSGLLVVGLTGSSYAWGCGPNKKCPTTTTTSTTTTTESTTTTSTTTTTSPPETTTTVPETTTTTIENSKHKPIKFTG